MILVLSGTKDGRDITKKLLEENNKVMVSVTTSYGQEILGHHPKMKIFQGKFNKESLKEVITNQKITLMIDSTHPYAAEISALGMEVAQEMAIPYFRFERTATSYEGIIEVKDTKEAVEFLKNTHGNIFLTTGSKTLDIFVEQLEKQRLYPRILPTAQVIEKCENLGLNAGQLIAIQGPFTKELNQAFYKQYDIEYMVTKESGSTGGTLEKIQGALELGIQVVLIQRPPIHYENIFSDIDKLLKAVKGAL